MRTVLATGAGTVEVVDVPEPELTGPDGVLVQVEAAAICGSDLHFYDGDLPFYPLSIGHEAIGRVVEAGPDVRRFAVGDRVLVASVTGCGTCTGCATLDPIRCVHGPRIFGTGDLAGAQAELLAVPAADFQLLAIPEGMSDEAALLLTDNLATGWAASEGAATTVVVLGLGAVGLCAYRSAVARGATTVLGFDPVAGRRARIPTPVEGELVPTVLEATGGRGADLVIDCVASDRSLDDAFACVASGGTVSVVGIHGLEPYPLNVVLGVYRSLTLRMTTAPIQRTWPDLLPRVASGALDTSGIFTDTFALADAAEAYKAVAARSADCVKALLRP
jgi:2-desacetyl-2-hydroxyethyl bacteriochlorophyllide A dehydrogenase